jgi:hypothetical protein
MGMTEGRLNLVPRKEIGVITSAIQEIGDIYTLFIGIKVNFGFGACGWGSRCVGWF